MQCSQPKFGYKKLYPTDSGKYQWTNNLSVANLDEPMVLPCGKCAICMAKRSKDLGLKAYHESLMHEQNCFMTVTYDNDHYDPNNKTYRDGQLFLKRLRANLHRHNPKNAKFRFLAVGESGDTNTHRWHYHFLIFGHDFLGGAYQINQTAYSHQIVDQSWNKGMVYIDHCTPASCNYVAGYVTKKLGANHHTVKAGSIQLGKDFVQAHYEDALNLGCFIQNGHPVAIPRSYYDLVQGKLDPIKEEKRLHAKANQPVITPKENKLRESARANEQQEKNRLTEMRRRSR